MRVRDLLPETEYATCDGMLVVTGKTVESGWFHFQETIPNDSGKSVQVAKIERGDPRNQAGRMADPWAKCKPSHRSGITMISGPGVRVHQYGYDRNGQRLVDGLTNTLVIKPADIPGTWADYVLLHGDVIGDKFLMRDLEEEAKEWRIATRALLEAAGIPVDDGTAPASRAKREGRAAVTATVLPDTDWMNGRTVRKGPPRIVRSIDFPDSSAQTVIDLLTKAAKRKRRTVEA